MKNPTWIEIYGSGRHTAMDGREFVVTDAHLADIAARYDPAKHEAPHVVGHPATDAPAYGWVKELKAEGGKLLALTEQMDEAFADLVQAGRFKKRSAAFYGDAPEDWSLRHVGWLGAQPPAVKGLKDAVFAAGDGHVAFEGHETKPEQEKRPMKTVEQLEAELAEARAKTAEAEAKAKTAEDAAKEATAKFAEGEKARKAEARTSRFEKLLADGKAMPGEQAGVLAFAEALEGAPGTVCFAEGQAAEPIGEAFWKWLEAREPHALFAELTAPSGGKSEALGDLTKHA